MKTKNIMYFFIFLFIFLMNSGIIYILVMKPSLDIIFSSLLMGVLIMLPSFSFILMIVGIENNNMNENQKLIMRNLGYILLMVSIGYIWMLT